MQGIFEKIKERFETDYSQDVGNLKMISIDKAIEIVNQVAKEYGKDINVRSNEFCEWIRDNDEFDIYDTKCRNRHVFFEGSPEDNEYVYCPYCGKEIKVVE